MYVNIYSNIAVIIDEEDCLFFSAQLFILKITYVFMSSLKIEVNMKQILHLTEIP